MGFALITYFHVVAGELVPKSLALRRAEALAVAIAPPMLVFMAVTRPAVRLLSRSAAVILRGFDIPSTERAASIHSAEELKLIATAARRRDCFRSSRRCWCIARSNWVTCWFARL